MAKLSIDKICFVISPIGREGTETFARFRETLDFVIKPAVENSGMSLSVLRADDIQKSGSFIKDILEYISGAYVVLADLTGQNPNVFYELGVRHSLSPRTILISQSVDDIPSDLREYRTILYDTSAKGAATFAAKLATFLEEIEAKPERPDNPVLDRLPALAESRQLELQQEVVELREQLSNLLRGEPPKDRVQSATRGETWERVKRVLALRHLNRQTIPTTLTFDEGSENERVDDLPSSVGCLNLYFEELDDTDNVEVWYVTDSTYTSIGDLKRALADFRLLIDRFSHSPADAVVALVVDGRLGDRKQNVLEVITNMLQHLPEQKRKEIKPRIWDHQALEQEEESLGLKIELDAFE